MLRKSLSISFVIFIYFILQALASDFTVDEIIAKNIEARGGLEKIKAVKSLRMTGNMMARSQEMPFSIQMKRPNMVRVEFTLDGKAAIQAYDGEEGWSVMPFLGSDLPQKMANSDLQDMQEQADLDGPLVDYKSKGNTVELVGKDTLEGREAYKLKVTLKNGNVRYIYIGADTNLELKTTSHQKRQGQEFDVDAFLGDYKDINGIKIPYSVEQKVGDRTVSTFTVEKVEMDVDIDNSVFKFPAPASQTQTETSPTSR